MSAKTNKFLPLDEDKGDCEARWDYQLLSAWIAGYHASVEEKLNQGLKVRMKDREKAELPCICDNILGHPNCPIHGDAWQKWLKMRMKDWDANTDKATA